MCGKQRTRILECNLSSVKLVHEMQEMSRILDDFLLYADNLTALHVVLKIQYFACSVLMEISVTMNAIAVMVEA